MAKKKEAKIASEKDNLKKEKNDEGIKKSYKGLIFLTTIFLILVILGGCFVWYTKIYKKDTKPEEKEEVKVPKDTKLKFVSYDVQGALYTFIDDYILVYEESGDVKTLYSILNKKGEELKKFDTPVEYKNAYVGVDDNLYIENTIFDDDFSGERLELKMYKDGKLTDVYSEECVGYYNSLLLNEDSQEKLIGYSKVLFSDDEEEVENEIYILGKKDKIKYSGYSIVGEKASLTSGGTVITNSENYVVVRKELDDNYKYGVMDLKNGKIIIDFNYDELVQTNDKTFVAVKDNKAGIINHKLKKLVSFDYDFIDVNDDYYVVSKNNKLALMDKDYKFITDFVFDYQKLENTSGTISNNGYYYRIAENKFNTFYTKKIGEKYLLVINNNADKGIIYKKNEAYVISDDGKYEVIKENMIDEVDGLVYTYDKEKFEITVFDEELKEKSKISLKDYDIFDNNLKCYKFGKIINVEISNVSLYFNYEDGTELENPVYELSLNNVKVKIDFKNQNIKYYLDEQEQSKLSSNIGRNRINIYNYKDGRFAISNNGKLVVVRK